VTNGHTDIGYGLAIRDEKDKSSMGYEIGTKNLKRLLIYLCCENQVKTFFLAWDFLRFYCGSRSRHSTAFLTTFIMALTKNNFGI
jgi:hypothetical protein